MKQILSYMIDKLFPYEVNWIKDKSKFAIFENLKNRFIGQFLTNNDIENGYYFRWEDNTIPKEDVGKHSIDLSLNLEKIRTENGKLNPKIEGENNFVTGNSNLIFGNLNIINGQKISVYGNENIINEYNLDNEIYFCEFFELYETQHNEKFGSSVAVDDNYIYVGSPWLDLNSIFGNGKLIIFNKLDYSIVHEIYGSQNHEHFGYSITVDDNYIYVGCPWVDSDGLDETGKISVLDKQSFNLVHEFFGENNYNRIGKLPYSFTSDESYIFIGNPDNSKVFVYNKNDFSLANTLLGDGFSKFGTHITTDENYIYIGAPLENDKGSVSIYDKSFNLINKINSEETGVFGCSIAVNDNYLFIGDTQNKKVKIYDKASIGTSEIQKIGEIINNSAPEYFGGIILADNDNVYISCRQIIILNT